MKKNVNFLESLAKLNNDLNIIKQSKQASKNTSIPSSYSSDKKKEDNLNDGKNSSSTLDGNYFFSTPECKKDNNNNTQTTIKSLGNQIENELKDQVGRFEDFSFKRNRDNIMTLKDSLLFDKKQNDRYESTSEDFFHHKQRSNKSNCSKMSTYKLDKKLSLYTEKQTEKQIEFKAFFNKNLPVKLSTEEFFDEFEQTDKKFSNLSEIDDLLFNKRNTTEFLLEKIDFEENKSKDEVNFNTYNSNKSKSNGLPLFEIGEVFTFSQDELLLLEDTLSIINGIISPNNKDLNFLGEISCLVLKLSQLSLEFKIDDFQLEELFKENFCLTFIFLGILLGLNSLNMLLTLKGEKIADAFNEKDLILILKTLKNSIGYSLHQNLLIFYFLYKDLFNKELIEERTISRLGVLYEEASMFLNGNCHKKILQNNIKTINLSLNNCLK